MNCPKCGGENVQTIQMAILGGTSTGNVVGVGVSLSGGNSGDSILIDR